jgi:hypothetical protein
VAPSWIVGFVDNSYEMRNRRLGVSVATFTVWSESIHRFEGFSPANIKRLEDFVAIKSQEEKEDVKTFAGHNIL